MNTKLINAVNRQIGGTKSERMDTYRDVCRGGADAGFHGFLYYKDTLGFFRRNKAHIVEAVEEMASDLGENPLDMVAGFRCLNRDFSTSEVARVLYGPWKDDDAHTMIGNALAWFALEEVARLVVDD